MSEKIINHIGLSGGKDSTALWGWAINDSGYPRETIRGSFCDTVNEYDEVYQQIRFLDEYGQKRGITPIRILGSEGFLNLVIRKKTFPSAKVRFCTEELKIFPMLHYLEELWLDGYEVVLHSGVRAAESKERAAMDEFGFNNHCRQRRPLLKWTIQDVWDAHKRYGLPINPLYFTGRRRVGCKLCCMSNKQDVRITDKTRPETIEMYKDWEKIVSDEIGSVACFFRNTMVPAHFRSIKNLIRKNKTTKYEARSTFDACSISDVVKWSMTLHGGKQTGFDFMFDDSPVFETDDQHEPCKSGYCE